jgi:hypothetical protein
MVIKLRIQGLTKGLHYMDVMKLHMYMQHRLDINLCH